MRASRYFIFFYAAMGVLPILTLGIVISMLLQLSSLRIFLGFFAVDIIVFSLLGITELFYREKRIGKNTLKHEKGSYGPMNKINEIKLVIGRFSTQKKELRDSSYIIKTSRFESVLDGLIDVKQTQDPSLSVRYSCRMGICGSCGVVINGKPSLACETNINEVAKKGVVVVEPMQTQPILKDLVTDFDDFFEKHKSVEPILFRKNNKEKMAAINIYDKTQEEVNKFLPFSYCIMCGLCMDACPVVNTNPEFIGPQALAQVYRYKMDSRDQKGEERITAIDKLTGLWGCEFAGACSKACPKGVDPASAIQLLKIATAEEYMKFNNEKNEV